jgi:hypothetical protein
VKDGNKERNKNEGKRIRKWEEKKIRNKGKKKRNTRRRDRTLRKCGK